MLAHDPTRLLGAPERALARLSTTTYQALRLIVEVLVVGVPGVVGVFWGAPLIAHELETGTYRLALTQSVTRTRWLAVKLGLVGLASMAFAGLITLMVTWWSSPIDSLNADQFAPLLFSERNIVPIGYAAFAFLLGATAGVLIRRTLPAMAITVAGFVGVRLAMTYWVRPHLAAQAHRDLPITASTHLGIMGSRLGIQATAEIPKPQHSSLDSAWNFSKNAWVFSDHIVDNAGHAPTSQFLQSASLRQPHTLAGVKACDAKIGTRFHQLVTYQPASHYWPFQISTKRPSSSAWRSSSPGSASGGPATGSPNNRLSFAASITRTRGAIETYAARDGTPSKMVNRHRYPLRSRPLPWAVRWRSPLADPRPRRAARQPDPVRTPKPLVSTRTACTA
jgi:hypothetical protein